MRPGFRSLVALLVLLVGTAAARADERPGNPRVALATSLGRIVLELDAARAPKTVANFLAYVRSGHYDGTVVYRVTHFLIQAGSTNPDFSRRPTREPIPNEADNGLENLRGTVGMARYGPHTATAEFYINTSDNPWLDHTAKTDEGWGYCVFGRVVEGMDTVDAIARVETGARHGLEDVPLAEVRIERATLEEP